MSAVARIQIHHEPLPQSRPYPAEIESALAAITNQGLVERGWDRADTPGIIRHETGAEIIVLVIALAELSAAILNLIAASRTQRPETTISIQVAPDKFAKVLEALKDDS